MTENPARQAPAEPIAIVGMACRFPDATGPAEYLELVLTGRRAFRRMPPVRLDVSEYGDGEPGFPGPSGLAPGVFTSVRAALLEGWRFDRAAYGVTLAAYRAADPAHWLALETAARALADGGFPGGQGLTRDRTGVIIGNTLTGEVSRATALRARWPYVRRVLRAALAAGEVSPDRHAEVIEHAAAGFLAPFPEIGDDTLAGSLPGAIADRICGHFGFRGGGHAVDAAHSSSLLAIAAACSALAAGDLDAAIAGGVDISLDPFELAGLAGTGALASGDMRVFDTRPTGFLPGEGCGLTVLMRAAEARSAGVPVYAEIAGWGVSSAGNPALTRPGSASLLLALRRAYHRAQVDPADVQLIEGDGTGTASGDLAELTSLAEIRQASPRLAALGSVKANIGHTKAAAGAAGLIKATLAIAAGIIPPATGCTRPHPLIASEDARLRVPEAAEPWPERIRLAGVTSVGPGGASVHLILRRARDGRRRRAPGLPLLQAGAAGRGRGGAGGAPGAGLRGGGRGKAPAASIARSDTPARGTPDPAAPLLVPAPRVEAFAVSGADRQALARELNRIAELAPWLSDGELHDLACQYGRATASHDSVRAGLVAGSQDELAQGAREALALLPGLDRATLATAPGVVIADRGLGRVALLFPGEASLPPVRPRPTAGPGAGPHDPALHPAIVATSLSALEWLIALGVTAVAGVGHGLGEITGLVWAGCLTEADANRLTAQRSALLAALPTAPPAGQTALVCADMGRPDAEALCAGTDLVITAYNGPRCHVLAGPAALVHDLAIQLAEDGVPARLLDSPLALYSPAMAEQVAPMRSVLRQISFRPPTRRLISTITGAEVTKGDDLAALLATQLTSPVQFARALGIAAAEADLLIEAGPGRQLASLAADCSDVPAFSLAAGRGDETATAQAAAALFASGAVATLAPLFGARLARPIDIWRERVFIPSPCGAPAPDGDSAGAGRLITDGDMASGGIPATHDGPTGTGPAPARLPGLAARPASGTAQVSGTRRAPGDGGSSIAGELIPDGPIAAGEPGPGRSPVPGSGLTAASRPPTAGHAPKDASTAGEQPAAGNRPTTGDQATSSRPAIGTPPPAPSRPAPTASPAAEQPAAGDRSTTGDRPTAGDQAASGRPVTGAPPPAPSGPAQGAPAGPGGRSTTADRPKAVGSAAADGSAGADERHAPDGGLARGQKPAEEGEHAPGGLPVTGADAGFGADSGPVPNGGPTGNGWPDPGRGHRAGQGGPGAGEGRPGRMGAEAGPAHDTGPAGREKATPGGGHATDAIPARRGTRPADSGSATDSGPAADGEPTTDSGPDTRRGPVAHADPITAGGPATSHGPATHEGPATTGTPATHQAPATGPGHPAHETTATHPDQATSGAPAIRQGTPTGGGPGADRDQAGELGPERDRRLTTSGTAADTGTRSGADSPAPARGSARQPGSGAARQATGPPDTPGTSGTPGSPAATGSGEPPARPGPQADEKPDSGRPASERPADGKPAGGKAAGERRSVPKPADEQSAGERAAGRTGQPLSGTHHASSRSPHARTGSRPAASGSYLAGPGASQVTDQDPRGTALWVRCFTEELRPTAPPAAPATTPLPDASPAALKAPLAPGAAESWQVRASAAHPYGALDGFFADGDSANGNGADRDSAHRDSANGNGVNAGDRGAGPVLAVLGDPAEPANCAALLGAARDAIGTGRLVVITPGPGLTGLCASLHAEHPGLGITLIRVQPGRAGLAAARRFANATPGVFRELVLDGTGAATEPVMVATDPAADGTFPLGPADVVLLSGITRVGDLACATSLAGRGAALAVIAPPGPEDPRIAALLTRLRSAGIRVSRKKADLTDPGQVAAAVRSLERGLGPVTAVVHAAASGPVERCARLAGPALRNFLAGQRGRFSNVIGAVAMERVRVLVTFGSIAARYGRAGGACDGLASGLLAERAARLAEGWPRCRVLHLDWAPWAEPDYGDRPGGRHPAAAQPGQATPIPVEEGSRYLLSLLTTADMPARAAVHGRLGAPGPAALRPALTGSLARGRFVTAVRVHYPGVELVADTRLSVQADPYLADYRIDDLPMLPAAMVLEAMAQTASALAGREQRHLTDVRLAAPVLLLGRAGHEEAVIRVCALRVGDTVQTVLRCAETGFRLDHARAVFHLAGRPAAAPAAGWATGQGRGAGGVVPGTMVDGTDLYGQVFFQTGRFRRVAFLPEASSRACRALVRGGDDLPWFGAVPGAAPGAVPGPVDAPLVLGSPGLNDASLHVLQACLPHRRLLATGCESVTFSGREVRGALRVQAVRRPPMAGDLVGSWDVVAADATGQPVVTWQGVRLRDVGALAPAGAWHPALFAISMEARAAEFGLDPALRAVISCGGPPPGQGTGGPGGRDAGRLPGGPSTAAPGAPARGLLVRGPLAGGLPTGDDPGWIDQAEGTGPLAGFELTVRASHPVACRWQAVGGLAGGTTLLDEGLIAIRDQLAARLREPSAALDARLATIASALAALGWAPGTPLRVEEACDAGWIAVRARDMAVASAVTRLSGVAAPVAVALASLLVRHGPAGPGPGGRGERLAAGGR